MRLLRLFHFSSEVVVLDREYKYDERGYLKPAGFWVSVEDGDGWSDWCRVESFALDRLQYVHTVTLADDARILYLTTVAEIRAFHDEYAEPYIGHPGFLQIAWHRVAEKYQGIIIAPYQWSLRLDLALIWYGGWDCASGCIWDLSAIASLDVIEQ